MRNFISLLLLILFFGSFPSIVKGQQMEISKVYIHEEEPSFKSQFFQKVASIFGVKNHIERNIMKHKFNQEVASIPKYLQNSYHFAEKKFKGRSCWIISSKEKISNKVILYLHGGAYYWNISKYNWSFAEVLLERTNATIIMPDYPLAPDTTCEQTYMYMEGLYRELISKYDADDIVILGESAGGGLALGLSMFLRDRLIPLPDQLILLAPWLDLTMSNPDLLNIDPKDKILGIKGLQKAGKGYAGSLDLEDYRVSPIQGDLSSLPQISLFTGTHDLLLADAKALKSKAEASNIPINYFEYPKMFHVWILMKQLKEAKVAIDQIASLIME